MTNLGSSGRLHSSSEGKAKEGTEDYALQLDRVWAGYGEAVVIRDLTLDVPRGQVVALLGPNGAGKTTTLRVAMGILRPTSGDVRIGGEVVTHTSPHERTAHGICLIPEGRGVFRSLTVRENLRLFLSVSERKPSDALDRALSVFPALAMRMNEYAGRLSGGQQQMLAVARAYVTNPKVILLDEVSMGLAPLVIEEMFSVLGTLAQTGVSMLIVEQYINRAMAMADSVVLLNKGSVTYQGPPANLDEEVVLHGYFGAAKKD
jgi:branched-chain amino acid transport system ATP-binding protein